MGEQQGQIFSHNPCILYGLGCIPAVGFREEHAHSAQQYVLDSCDLATVPELFLVSYMTCVGCQALYCSTVEFQS